MMVTKHHPEKGYSVVGFDGTAIPKHSDAFEFNARTNERYGPSNFVAQRRYGEELGAAVTWMTLDGPTERPKSAP
jgi:hypothetical protein